jgi:ATP-dependent RNA helicase RhlE
VNFDLPLVAEDYIHRAGRTGRAGMEGRAVSLVSPADADLLRGIQRLLSSPIQHVAIEGYALSSTSHEALSDRAPRPRGRQNRGFGGSNSRPSGNRPSGPRPSRPGGSGRGSSRPGRSFARG